MCKANHLHLRESKMSFPSSSNPASSIKDELSDLDPVERINLQIFAVDSDDEITNRMHELFKQDIFLVRLRQLVWQQLQCSSDDTPLDSDALLVSAVSQIMDDSGFKSFVHSYATKVLERAALQRRSRPESSLPVCARTSSAEACDHVRQARVNWETGILEEIAAIVDEAKRPFLLRREPGVPNPLLVQNYSQHEANNDSVKFLFDSEDLMETIVAIRNPNMKSAQIDRIVGLIKLNISTPDFESLTKRFAELHCSYSQLGLDESHANAQGFKLLAFRHEEGEALIANNGPILEARKFLRRGCPLSLRGKIFRLACGLHEKPTSAEEQYFLRLRNECDRMDLVTDELFMHDIEAVLDDPRFFVFEEELKEVIFSFARDSSVRQQAAYEIHTPFLRQMGAEYEDSAAPPCGVQPFLGLATYFAPLCYIYKDKVSLYHVSRFMYCNLWCKLNVISSSSEHDGTLIYVCKTFESLLMQSHPQLMLHLTNLGLPPLKIAFPWIQLGFVGYLEIEQLLHLWDRLLGFMDTTLLAVMAVAIFLHRSEMLLKCATEAEATMVLMEGSRLHVVTLLQMFLFKRSKHP